MSDEQQQDAWDVAWNRYMGTGNENRERIAALLSIHPNMSGAEIGRQIGCSRESACKHKRRIQQGKTEESEA